MATVAATIGLSVQSQAGWDRLDALADDVHHTSHELTLINPGRDDADPWWLCVDCEWSAPLDADL